MVFWIKKNFYKLLVFFLCRVFLLYTTPYTHHNFFLEDTKEWVLSYMVSLLFFYYISYGKCRVVYSVYSKTIFFKEKKSFFFFFLEKKNNFWEKNV